ncbi:MAG: hypothetical protein R3A52_07740 [Polyangiales bacterium]
MIVEEDATVIVDEDRVEFFDDDIVSIDGDVPDADVVDVPDVDTGTVVAPPDGGIQMTFTFVSAALVSPPDASIQMNAQISWHGSLSGSAGGITFHGTIH